MDQTIMLAVLTILSTIMTGILIPYLRTRIRRDDRVRMMQYAAVAVRAAEQIFTIREGESGAGERKYRYARDLLRKAFPSLSEDDAQALIEAAVYEINKWQEAVQA